MVVDDQTELESLMHAVMALAPPKPLPEGWIVKESRSQPGYHYYFNHLTGECTWYPPYSDEEGDNLPEGENGQLISATDDESRLKPTRKRSIDHVIDSNNTSIRNSSEKPPNNNIMATPAPPVVAVVSDAIGTTGEPKATAAITSTDDSIIISHSGSSNNNNTNKNSSSNNKKRHKRARPEQVRVLHILKKHKGARRPSSWRVPIITISKDEAIEQLKGLLELLHEVAADPKELRATMEELARTESDCSSAKRGGDLGFFGPKKMQPAFEEASFRLDIGELSDIVDTSSGVHVILRIG